MMSWIKRILGIESLDNKLDSEIIRLSEFANNTIDEVNDNFKVCEDNVNAINKNVAEHLQNMAESIKKQNKKIAVLEDRLSRMEQTVQIGVDVHQQYGKSWAVVCIAGRVDTVQFLDLSQKDARHILDFISGFESHNKCIDSPIGLRHIFSEK